MSRKPTWKRTRPKPKAVLRLPDSDQAKIRVLNSLTSADAQRSCRHASEELAEWYCSEPMSRTFSCDRRSVSDYRREPANGPLNGLRNSPEDKPSRSICN